MKMVRNIAIVAVAASLSFASVSFHMANNFSDLDGTQAVATSYGATFDLNGSTAVGYDSTLGMLFHFNVGNVGLRMGWSGTTKTSVGLGYTWWSGGDGLNTSISTNYDMVTTEGTPNTTDGNLSLVVGFGF
jgi:hypothetical protein